MGFPARASHNPPAAPGRDTPRLRLPPGHDEPANNHGDPAAGSAAEIEQVLAHFEQLETQFQKVREGLTHSHRLATLGTIASVIAHEYNNILTPIISYAQLSLASPDDAELMKKTVEKALSGAQRAASISSSLLGFAREQDHEHVASLRPVIDEAIACLGRSPEKDGVELVIDVPEVTLAISPLNLQQVLLNLALNARKAMRRRGGRLSFTGRVEGGVLRLDIADTGPGIPPQIMDRLFEPFVTHPPPSETPGHPGHPETSEAAHGGGGEPGGEGGGGAGVAAPRGTGLGLCICRDLLRAAGGTIHAQSPPGRGATFTLTVPLAAELLETT